MFDWLKGKRTRGASAGITVTPALPQPPVPPPGRLAEPAARQARGIGYNPDLIGQYHEDHRRLLALFGQATAAAQAGQWAGVDAALQRFRSALTDHLLSESIRLYTYLKQQVAGDPEAMALMKSFASEMGAIGRVVIGFLDEQKDLEHAPQRQAAFLQAWADIGRTLGDRIVREEKTLYPMYRDRP
ncbi:MAG: hypothetical protein AMXMBFR66_04710 [Pseudomonadota bacterium]|nr:hemerythrin domain-containing protein [Rubrivivax sp.]NLZ40909.1 hemerythrin domain-containing protein [Comamonadaceae bacterium]